MALVPLVIRDTSNRALSMEEIREWARLHDLAPKPAKCPNCGAPRETTCSYCGNNKP